MEGGIGLEELIPVLFIIIGAIASMASSAKKEKERKEAKERHQAAAKARIEAAARKMQPQAQPARGPIQPSMAAPMTFADVPGQVITPKVHTHVQPDCVTHDAPGSLGVTSAEGKDPCHEEQLTHARTFTEPAQENSSLTLEWSGENMVKAFVMQEVLTRPCQRRAR